ncbi:hypothetical protein HCB90_01465 [Streptococcus suis]|nr:hypothetical protein [Streptococcus suis]
MKKIKALLLALTTVLLLTACSASNQSLDGTYTYEEDGSIMTIIIDGRQDGSLSIEAGDGSGSLFVDNISTDFTVDKENKIFNVEGEELEYSLSGNTLTVSGDGFGTVKLERE